MIMKKKNGFRGIITTEMSLEEDSSSNSTRLRSHLVDLSPSIPIKKYGYVVTFVHRTKGNRSAYGGCYAKKASVEFELYIQGIGNTRWTQRIDVPLKHRRVWDFMENSAPVIWETNKWSLSLWMKSKNQKKDLA